MRYVCIIVFKSTMIFNLLSLHSRNFFDTTQHTYMCKLVLVTKKNLLAFFIWQPHVPWTCCHCLLYSNLIISCNNATNTINFFFFFFFFELIDYDYWLVDRILLNVKFRVPKSMHGMNEYKDMGSCKAFYSK